MVAAAAATGVGGAASAAGPLTGVVAIESGSRHACAIIAGGQVLCWGDNDEGQLGDGTTADRPLPVTVLTGAGGAPLSGVTALSAGDDHTCARLGSGQLRCWGDNVSGQLGDGTTTDRRFPVTVRTAPGGGALTSVASVNAGDGHTCARVGAQVRCWGDNFAGQLGDGTTTTRPSPVTVRVAPGGAALSGVASVQTGFWHTCARLTSGQARCWGDNGFGQLSDGTNIDRSVPGAVLNSLGGTPLTGIAELFSGSWHTCARLTTGQARCWGDDGFGQLGDGDNVDKPFPVTVITIHGEPLTTITSLAGGGNHTCARIQNGRLRCWGRNGGGQLGDGTTTNRPTAAPVLVDGAGTQLTGIGTVTAGSRFSCARTTAGGALCWGFNGQGEVGDGTLVNRAFPVPVQT